MLFSRDMVRGSIAPCILKLLGRRPMYPYEIIKLAALSTDGAFAWKEGSVYPCLARMEASGLVASTLKKKRGEHPRRYYRLTAKGRKRLALDEAEWRSFRAALDSIMLSR